MELAELVEQRQRAVVQHRQSVADKLQRDIDAVQLELVETAEELATGPAAVEVHASHAADVA